MLEVQSLYKPTPPHQPTAKRRRLRLTSVPLVDLRAPQKESSQDGVDLYGSLSSPPKSLMSDVDTVSNKSGVCSVSESMDSQRLQGSCRIRHLNSSWETESRFPKLNECAHFHYEYVELGPIDVCLYDEESQENCKPLTNGISEHNNNFSVQVASNGKSWVVRRSYENFCLLDRQLHQCVYDRKFSALPEILKNQIYGLDAKNVSCDVDSDDNKEQINHAAKRAIEAALSEYLHRFSDIAGNLISCGPILNWLELDNRGNRLIVTDDSAINTPAVAAAYVTKRYISQANDEISFEVGDMISVIDMPPSDESIWWRGKRGFEVGFFPSECVEVIGDKVPHTIHIPKAPTKPVLRKHGKLIAFFRSFILSRPSRRKLKQSGILRERVFGCDLGEHLLNSGHDIPMVLKCCADFIEAHGIVDGIYRLSGVTSNIQKLRNTFDEDRVPNLNDEAILQDIHSVASLLKMYFRELPNPLLTYQLYDKFVAAVQSDEEVRLLNLRDIVQQMPPPHYRTLEYLVKHLACVAAHGSATGMTPKNLAIVWAPNLLRSKDLEVGGVAALQVVGVQAVVTEFLIHYSDLIFNDKMPVFAPIQGATGGSLKRSRPKSLAISTPTKLLSLEEARSRALGILPGCQFNQKYIEVGGGPATLPSKYHTIIDLPDRKRGSTKNKKSPSGWKAFFVSKGRSSSQSSTDGDKHRRKGSSTPSDPGYSLNITDKAVTEVEMSRNINCLRTVKSAESLISSCAASSHRNSDVFDGATDVSRCTADTSGPILCTVADDDDDKTESVLSSSLGTVQPTPQRHSPHAHHRSVSHDSYFEFSLDHRQCERPPAELSTILSVDYEDGDVPILSSSDYADICFADQEKEPDGNGTDAVVLQKESPATDDIERNNIIRADLNDRLSFNFDDVPCDIIGDIQREVAAALHWNKETTLDGEPCEDTNEENTDDCSDNLQSDINDAKLVFDICEPELVADVSNMCHPLQTTYVDDVPDVAAHVVEENLHDLAKISDLLTNSAEVTLPPVSSTMKPPSLPDILYQISSVGVPDSHLVPCNFVENLAVWVPSTDDDVALQELQQNPEQLCEDYFSENALENFSANTLEEVVPKIHIWTELPSSKDNEEIACQVLQTDNLVAPIAIVELMMFDTEVTESDSSISHNLSSCGASSSAASPAIDGIHDPFAYYVLTNEDEGIMTPTTNENSAINLANECPETMLVKVKGSFHEELIPEIMARDENKENDALLVVELTSSSESSRLECSPSKSSCTAIGSDSPNPSSPVSPSRLLATSTPNDTLIVGLPDKLSPMEESKRKFESEIGRDILRERKMKLELERVQLETLQRPCEMLLTSEIGASSRESTLDTLVNKQSVEAAPEQVVLRKGVCQDDTNNMQSPDELKRASEPTISTNLDKIDHDKKRISESTVQTRTVNKCTRPERKASVRELMSKFEGGKSVSVSAQAKEDVEDFAVVGNEFKPLIRKTKSTGTPSTPPMENSIFINDDKLSAASSITSVVPVKIFTELTSDQGNKPCDAPLVDLNLLSKSASGKLETYGSEFPPRAGDDETTAATILSPLLTLNEQSMIIDPARRERIDRYKEERRAQLREKIRSESFKGELEGQKDYFRLKQKAVTPITQLDDSDIRTEGKEFFCTSWRRSRLSAGSPVDDNAKSEAISSRRRSAHVHRHSGESNLQTDFVLPVSPRKTSIKDLNDRLNSSIPVNRKILSSVEDNITKDSAETVRQTSQTSKRPKDLLLESSLHKVTSPQKESFYIDCASRKLRSPAKDKLQGHTTNSNLPTQEDAGLQPPPPPLRKIKDVAALFEQPAILLQRQFSHEGEKAKSKVSSTCSHLKTGFPSSM